jgi:hypothetical protein
MKKINKIKDFNPKFIPNKCDVIFDKHGLNKINDASAVWELNEQKTRFVSTEDESHQIPVTPLCKHKIGETVQWHYGQQVIIVDIDIMRLSSVTEEDAVRTGVQRNKEGYVHYSPSMFFPKEILKLQEPGFPFVKTAVASYGTLWIKQYGQLDLLINPWVWKYTFKSK